MSNAVKNLMIRDFRVLHLGYDFAGYEIQREKDLSFHHTIISRAQCKKEHLGDGYWYWNGSILVQNTSHNYLHEIQRHDEDRFYAISSELIDENIKGKIDRENLERIEDILRSYEREFDVPKEEYVRRLMLWKKN